MNPLYCRWECGAQPSMHRPELAISGLHSALYHTTSSEPVLRLVVPAATNLAPVRHRGMGPGGGSPLKGGGVPITLPCAGALLGIAGFGATETAAGPGSDRHVRSCGCSAVSRRHPSCQHPGIAQALVVSTPRPCHALLSRRGFPTDAVLRHCQPPASGQRGLTCLLAALCSFTNTIMAATRSCSAGTKRRTCCRKWSTRRSTEVRAQASLRALRRKELWSGRPGLEQGGA